MPPPPRVPDFIPSPGLAIPEFDATEAFASDTGQWPGDRPGGRLDAALGGPPLGRIGEEPATLATVDKPAALVAPPRPRYPDRLRTAGVSGRVVVRFVVDTAGRVELASVVVRESSHELFSQAVRAVLPSLRFTPARVGGGKVRMLVDLPFEFRLNE